MAATWRLRMQAVALVAASFAGGGCEERPEPDARFVAVAEIKGFDPVYANDSYSAGAQIQVYEGLYEIHYLKRPLQMVPLLADGMPEVSEDGLTYTFHLKKGVRFQDDPCFPGGKGRELTAHDFVWCWKRLMAIPDSTGRWLFEGKVQGLDAWSKRAGARLGKLFDRVNEHFPFEHPTMREVVAEEVEGLRAIDDHTLRVRLTEPYPQFLWTLVMSFTVVYPREAVARYGMELMAHPVGTGAYRVEDFWIYDRKITYVRNPSWHGGTYPTEGAPGDEEKGLLADAGRPLPFLERVEFLVIPTSQPRWLRFLDRELDRVETEREIWEKAMTLDGKLRPELAAQGIAVQVEPKADIAFTAFNMDDPVIGAPAGDRGRKVRQAMSLAYDTPLWIKIMRNGSWGIPAHGPIPPTVAGYVSEPRSPYSTRDVARARKLLEEAGFPGGRGLPKLHYEMSGADAVSRNGAEILRNNLREIGIEIDLHANTWDQFDEKVKGKQAQVFGMAWGADYPDAQNFLQLFYGPHESPGPNNSNYKNPEYDRLYDQMKLMLPGPERDEVIRKMLAVLNEDCPWSYTDHRVQYSYRHAWLRNFKYMDINPWLFKYYRVDREEKARRLASGR